MATIAQSSAAVVGQFTVTETTLGASDTFAYDSNQKYLMILRNTTASPVTVTVDGSGASNAIPVPGYGNVDATAGKALTVPANGVIAVRLATISAFLQGTIAVTGGTGVVASIVSNI